MTVASSTGSFLARATTFKAAIADKLSPYNVTPGYGNLNRIDATVVFHALSREHIHSIVDLMIALVRTELGDQKMDLEISDAARDYLAEKGYDPHFGARPLRRLIQNEIEDRLSEAVLGGELHAGDTAYVDLEDDTIVIKTKVAVAS